MTGRKALYVNRGMTLYIEGMARAESDALLKRIFDHQEQARFQYSHVWRPGDLLMWDNRCTLHARADFPANERRMLLSVTVWGKAALTPPHHPWRGKTSCRPGLRTRVEIQDAGCNARRIGTTVSK